MSTAVDETGKALRGQIGDLLQGLSEAELQMVSKFVEFVYYGAGLHTAANAPIDDEPETEEERRAVELARDSLDRNAGVLSQEELRRRLGL
jgi:hypothetical protein